MFDFSSCYSFSPCTKELKMDGHGFHHQSCLSTLQHTMSVLDSLWKVLQSLHQSDQHEEYKRALRSGEAAQSALAEHAMEENHPIKCEDAKGVDHNP